MPLRYAAIVPHSPLLIPEIGKENTARLKNTSKAYEKIKEEIKKHGIETVIIITPHGPIQENTFAINLCHDYAYDFEAFGNFALRGNFSNDIGLLHRIRESLETKAKLQLITEQKLDYGAAIPLKLLLSELPEVKIIPLYYSGLDNQTHYEFGKILQETLFHYPEKIAVIASGDLSHCHTKEAPLGYCPRAKKFDKKIVDALKNKKPEDILKFETELIIEVHECGLRSILILLGILDGINYKANILAYESPFGIGYLTADFKL